MNIETEIKEIQQDYLNIRTDLTVKDGKLILEVKPQPKSTVIIVTEKMDRDAMVGVYDVFVEVNGGLRFVCPGTDYYQNFHFTEQGSGVKHMEQEPMQFKLKPNGSNTGTIDVSIYKDAKKAGYVSINTRIDA